MGSSIRAHKCEGCPISHSVITHATGTVVPHIDRDGVVCIGSKRGVFGCVNAL